MGFFDKNGETDSNLISSKAEREAVKKVFLETVKKKTGLFKKAINEFYAKFCKSQKAQIDLAVYSNCVQRINQQAGGLLTTYSIMGQLKLVSQEWVKRNVDIIAKECKRIAK